MDDDQTKLIELMRDLPIAMFTTTGEDGALQSVPMALCSTFAETRLTGDTHDADHGTAEL
jgi:general stress protein 26